MGSSVPQWCPACWKVSHWCLMKLIFSACCHSIKSSWSVSVDVCNFIFHQGVSCYWRHMLQKVLRERHGSCPSVLSFLIQDNTIRYDCPLLRQPVSFLFLVFVAVAFWAGFTFSPLSQQVLGPALLVVLHAALPLSSSAFCSSYFFALKAVFVFMSCICIFLLLSHINNVAINRSIFYCIYAGKVWWEHMLFFSNTWWPEGVTQHEYSHLQSLTTVLLSI